MRFDFHVARSLRVSLIAPLLLAAPLCGASDGDSHPAWTRSGDVLQWGIPLIAFGLSFVSEDENRSGGGDAPGLNWPGPRLEHSPQLDFLISFVRMEVTTEALKYTLDTRRPNGGSQSFPSGHSAAAFMGAEFIRKQHGNWWGAPAYAAASWVGYTRVESDNHYWYDVLGGALIGIASNYDFDHIDTPVGHLSFGPATFDANVGSHPETEDPLASLADIPSRFVPGLLVELRF